MITSNTIERRKPSRFSFLRKNKLARDVHAITKPTIFLIGSDSIKDEVIEKLNPRENHIIVENSFEEVKPKLNEYTLAIVYLNPTQESEVKTPQRRRLKSVPVHVVIKNNISDSEALNFYKRGVSNVIRFSSEKDMILDIIELSKKRGPFFNTNCKVEKKLSKALWVRAKVVLGSVKTIRLWYHDGVAYLIGKIPSKEQKNTLKKVVNGTPGVYNMVVSELKV